VPAPRSGKGDRVSRPVAPVPPGVAEAEPGRPETLVAIGQAAARCGVSERALRYYQEIGLLTPSGRTPGGLRRYAQADLDRVSRIRELQTLLGLNLDEVKEVLGNEDRLGRLRQEYRSEATDAARRRELIHEALALRLDLRHTVAAKRDALQRFLDDTDAEIEWVRRLVDDGVPVPAT
jgi:MerR family transcriptional regulator, repressor of the yfmOP operon